jgi:hypothetical protein
MALGLWYSPLLFLNRWMGLLQLREREDRHLSAGDRERKYGKAAT